MVVSDTVTTTKMHVDPLSIKAYLLFEQKNSADLVVVAHQLGHDQRGTVMVRMELHLEASAQGRLVGEDLALDNRNHKAIA